METTSASPLPCVSPSDQPSLPRAAQREVAKCLAYDDNFTFPAAASTLPLEGVPEGLAAPEDDLATLLELPDPDVVGDASSSTVISAAPDDAVVASADSGLTEVVLGIGSFLVDPLCRMIGARLVWAISNFTVFICMIATAILSWISSDLYSSALHIIGANKAIRNSALIVFSLLGLPLSITYSVPFSVTAELTAGTGGGQGLATGVLNLAIVVPQIIVSLGAGPWDALFGGGNIPAFALASVFSLAAGVLAVVKLPKLSNSYRSAGFHGFG